MLNIIHKPSKKDPSAIYEEIGSISPLPKGFNCPAQVNPTFLLDYDNFDEEKFNSLPDFIKLKMQGSLQYKAIEKNSNDKAASYYEEQKTLVETEDDGLPF